MGWVGGWAGGGGNNTSWGRGRGCWRLLFWVVGGGAGRGVKPSRMPVVAPRVFPLEPSTLRLEQGISRSEEASLPLLPSLHCSATSRPAPTPPRPSYTIAHWDASKQTSPTHTAPRTGTPTHRQQKTANRTTTIQPQDCRSLSRIVPCLVLTCHPHPLEPPPISLQGVGRDRTCTSGPGGRVR